MTEKVPLDELCTRVPSSIDLFICSASFEGRCKSIAARLAPRIKKAVVIRNRGHMNTSEVEAADLQRLFGEKFVEAPLSLETPTIAADVLDHVVLPLMQAVGNGTVFIDITTFTHEQLLILLGLIQNRQPSCRIIIGYTGAGEYSTNTDEANVWLSRGVRQVRSVLGYPGKLVPSKRLHLMVLVGFENERAQKLIEIMEPTKLSLGLGAPGKSVSPEHFSRNKRFYQGLQSFVGRQTRIHAEVDTFTFSCIDPYEARDAVLAHAAKYTEFNTVICPMNTKISTLGAGLAALDQEQIQIVYALPAEYNISGYSTPGPTATTFPLTLRQYSRQS